MIEQTYPDRAAWLEARKPTIGASEAPTIYGCNRWQSRYRLWGEKLGLVERRAPDDDWGNCLEDGVSRAYAQSTGDIIIVPPPYTIQRNPKYPWAHCTVDRFLRSQRYDGLLGIQEMKLTGGWAENDWKESPPLAVSVQCQHQMAITGLEWAVAVALIGTFRFKLVWGFIERDQVTIDLLMDEERQFMELLKTRTPPAIDGGDDAREVVEALHPNGNGQVIELPDECLDWDADILESQKLVEYHQSRYDLRRNQLRAAIGDYTHGHLSTGVIYTHKAGKDGVRRLKRKDRRQR